MISDVTINKEKMLEASKHGYTTATDLADWLVKELKIPFRKSHEISGRIVKLAEKNNCLLHELPLDSFKSIEKKINNNVFKVLSVENSVKSKISYGGTSPKEVLKQIKNAKRRFLK